MHIFGLLGFHPGFSRPSRALSINCAHNLRVTRMESSCCLFRLNFKIPTLPNHSNNSLRSGWPYPLHDQRRFDLIAKSIYVRNNELFFLGVACVAGVRKGRGRELERETSRAPRVSLAPKTPFPFPFKRLPRRLFWGRNRKCARTPEVKRKTVRVGGEFEFSG